jgi:hypothetical protein
MIVFMAMVLLVTAMHHGLTWLEEVVPPTAVPSQDT